MYPFRRILCANDYSLCAEVARRQALRLAKAYGAEVHVVHVDQGPAHVRASGGDGAAGTPVPVYDQFLHPLVKHLRVHAPDPVAVLLDYVTSQGMDLVVMGTHGDGAADRYLRRGGGGLLGITAEQVVRHADAPVMTCGLCHPGEEGRVSRLLVPFDFSASSRLAATCARDLAALFDARLELLHVRSRSDDRDEETLRQALVEAFERLGGPKVSVGFTVAAGPVARQVRSLSHERSIDLIVQGARSDGGGRLLGEVAAQVVRSVMCPVLTMRGTPAAPASLYPPLAAEDGERPERRREPGGA